MERVAARSGVHGTGSLTAVARAFLLMQSLPKFGYSKIAAFICNDVYLKQLTEALPVGLVASNYSSLKVAVSLAKPSKQLRVDPVYKI